MTCYSFSFPIFLQDPLNYLSNKTLYPMVFWKTPSTLKIGLGALFSQSSYPSFFSDESWFAIYPFMQKAPHQHDPWGDELSPLFLLPQVSLVLDSQGRGSMTFYKKENIPPSPEEAAFYLQEGCPQTPYEDNILLQCDDLPNKRQWHSLIKKAFESTSLKKVVLARMTSLRFKDMLHPLSLLTYLDTRTLNSTLFAYIPSKEKAFLGASPELFYKRQGSTLSTAAVAGTRKRGTSQQEDAFLENELLHSEKDLEEFAFVVRFFEETLSSGCTRLHPSATMVKKTSTVQHLYKPFEALLKYPFQDEALISVLHPTPAVGGTPRKEALQFLQESEPFYRGYYAAPLGWVSSSITELIVAIRSSLVLNNTLTLFAGAGITKASDPEKEWEELNHKIKPLSTAYACLS